MIVIFVDMLNRKDHVIVLSYQNAVSQTLDWANAKSNTASFRISLGTRRMEGNNDLRISRVRHDIIKREGKHRKARGCSIQTTIPRDGCLNKRIGVLPCNCDRAEVKVWRIFCQTRAAWNQPIVIDTLYLENVERHF